jgi:lipopolysaccharide export system permease protein
MMSRIDRYIFWQLLGVFGFFAVVLVAIYWIDRAVGLLDNLLGDGHSVGIFVQMSLLTIPGVIELIAPMAAFGAAAFVANKLSSESELVVLQATGFSFFRLSRPAFFFGIAVALMTATVTNFLIPAAATQLRELNYEISRNSTGKFLKEGQFLRPSADIVLYIREISETGELLGLFVADTRDPSVEQIYTSQRAFVINDAGDPKLLMLDGLLQRKSVSEDIISVSRFSDFTFSLLSFVNDSQNESRGIKEIQTFDLLRASDSVVRETGANRAALQFSGHFRLTWPVSSGFTAMIGFSSLLLGGFTRLGLWRQMAFAVVMLVALYMVHIFTLSRGPQSEGGWILAYATPLFGAAATFAIIWAAGRPRRIKPLGNSIPTVAKGRS